MSGGGTTSAHQALFSTRHVGGRNVFLVLSSLISPGPNWIPPPAWGMGLDPSICSHQVTTAITALGRYYSDVPKAHPISALHGAAHVCTSRMASEVPAVTIPERLFAQSPV